MQRACVLGLFLVLPSLAAAQPTPAEAEQAKKLFIEGSKLRDEAKLPQACERFTESAKLVRRAATLLNIAEICNEKVGKVLAAHGAFLEAAALAETEGKPDLAAEARRRADALLPRLSRIVVKVADAPPGFEVKVDGEVITPERYGQTLVLEPVQHRVEASAPEREPFVRDVEPGSGGTLEVEIVLKAATKTTVKAPVAPTAPTAPVKRNGRRLVAYGLGGLGVVFVGVGSIFGLNAMSYWSDADPHCDDNNVCDPTGHDLAEKARSAGNVSTVTFGIGLAAIAGGVVLYVLSPNAKEVSVAPTTDGGAVLTWSGTF